MNEPRFSVQVIHPGKYVSKGAQKPALMISPGSLSGMDEESARTRIEETLRANAARPLYTGVAVCRESLRHALHTNRIPARCARGVAACVHLFVDSARKCPVSLGK